MEFFNKFKRKKRLGLSLRGGGHRASSYLGLLKLFEEEDIQIHAMVASSGGALVGGTYAAGASIEEILEHGLAMANYKLFDINNIKSLTLWDKEKAIEYGRKLIGNKNFQETKFKLSIQVTNSKTFKAEKIEEGEIVTAISASSAAPFLMDTIQIEENMYLDGDYSAGFDANYLRELGCDVVIGARPGIVDHKKINLPLYFASELQKVMRNLQDESIKAEPLDLLIDNMAPEEYDFLDPSKAHEHFEHGYQVALSNRDIILELLK